ncbi:hypothetical protein F5879DRAFT_217047 [Lentinula edodes]|nr:hypothetical protein F5879DRAFT_217047 [Lentinula edodes]
MFSISISSHFHSFPWILALYVWRLACKLCSPSSVTRGKKEKQKEHRRFFIECRHVPSPTFRFARSFNCVSKNPRVYFLCSSRPDISSLRREANQSDPNQANINSPSLGFISGTVIPTLATEVSTTY